jgi:broad specificity phosphatase PhoE
MLGRGMILLRHGQSEFNLHFAVARRDPGIIDPRLTDLGHDQARAAAARFAGQGITRVITSPYSRALQTAAPIARALGVGLIVNPIVRERYAFVCDIGSPRRDLARDWPGLDFGDLDDIWWPAEEEPEAGIAARARRFRAEMVAAGDWENTLVVSHWGFIRAMTGQRVGNGEWLRCDPSIPHVATE